MKNYHCLFVSAPPPVQAKKQKIVVKEEPKSFKVKIPPKRDEPPPPPPAKKEVKIFLESFYYGIFETGTDNDSGIAVKFEADVSSLSIYLLNFIFNGHLLLIYLFFFFGFSVPNVMKHSRRISISWIT